MKLRFFATILAIVTGHAAFAILTAIHFGIVFFATIFTIMTRHAAFAVFAAIHFGAIILAAIFTIMTGHLAFGFLTIFIMHSALTILHFTFVGTGTVLFGSGRCTLIFATAM